MLTKAEFLEKILSINSKYNTELIGKAFDTGVRLHDGQLRKSGEPYFIHPINVAIILAEIGMDDETVALLRRHKEEQDKKKEIVGSAWLQPESVFTSNTGHYYDRCLLNTQFRRFLKRHPEMKKITIHGLRHTNASMLIEAGENLDAISKHLGHASSEITSRVYAHMLAGVRVRITATISNLLR